MEIGRILFESFSFFKSKQAWAGMGINLVAIMAQTILIGSFVVDYITHNRAILLELIQNIFSLNSFQNEINQLLWITIIQFGFLILASLIISLIQDYASALTEHAALKMQGQPVISLNFRNATRYVLTVLYTELVKITLWLDPIGRVLFWIVVISTICAYIFCPFIAVAVLFLFPYLLFLLFMHYRLLPTTSLFLRTPVRIRDAPKMAYELTNGRVLEIAFISIFCGIIGTLGLTVLMTIIFIVGKLLLTMVGMNPNVVTVGVQYVTEPITITFGLFLQVAIFTHLLRTKIEAKPDRQRPVAPADYNYSPHF